MRCWLLHLDVGSNTIVVWDEDDEERHMVPAIFAYARRPGCARRKLRTR